MQIIVIEEQGQFYSRKWVVQVSMHGAKKNLHEYAEKNFSNSFDSFATNLSYCCCHRIVSYRGFGDTRQKNWGNETNKCFFLASLFRKCIQSIIVFITHWIVSSVFFVVFAGFCLADTVRNYVRRQTIKSKCCKMGCLYNIQVFKQFKIRAECL